MLQWWRGGPDPPARLFTAGWPGGAARAGWLYLLYRGLVAATLLAGLVSSFLQESIGFLARGETENYNHLKYLVCTDIIIVNALLHCRCISLTTGECWPR